MFNAVYYVVRAIMVLAIMVVAIMDLMTVFMVSICLFFCGS